MAKHKYIETPEIMWQLFEDYIKHETNNPFNKVEYVGRDGHQVVTPLPVPITFMGFELYLQDLEVITDLSHYVANTDGAYDDYRTIITRIQNNCFVQNYKGAAVGQFNANLIARKLGLMEKQDISISAEIKQITGMDIK